MFVSPWVLYTLAYSLQTVVSESDFVHLPIRRINHDGAQNNAESVAKRDINVDLPYLSDFFSINVGIGSSKEEVSLILDTGSSDMIVIASENPGCLGLLADSCKTDGTFNRNSSTTFKEIAGTNFTIEYGDGTIASGSWVQDSIDLNGVNVDLTFGLANETSSTSVFGIGLQGLEFADTKYNNFPLQLKAQGLIDTSSYSVYLEYDKKNGDILFGAVDVNKIDKDNFYTIPMINVYAEYDIPNPIRTQVTMQGIGLKTEDGSQITISQVKLPALLDTGSTLSYLPNNIFNNILKHLTHEGINVTESSGENSGESTGVYEIDCEYASDETTLVVIDFGGFQIDIPLGQLIVNTTTTDACVFGFAPNDDKTVTLGDSFFSSAYVAFNLDNYEVSISPLQDSAESNIQNIKNGTVPYAKKGDSYDDPWTTDDEVPLGGNIFTMNMRASATSNVQTTLATVVKSQDADSASNSIIATPIPTKIANATALAEASSAIAHLQAKWGLFDLGGEVMDILNIIINAIAS